MLKGSLRIWTAIFLFAMVVTCHLASIGRSDFTSGSNFNFLACILVSLAVVSGVGASGSNMLIFFIITDGPRNFVMCDRSRSRLTGRPAADATAGPRGARECYFRETFFRERS